MITSETQSLPSAVLPVAARVSRASTDDLGIRPFTVRTPQPAIDDLRRRLALTRFPDAETVADASRGVQLADLQELVRYWATDYDWRKAGAHALITDSRSTPMKILYPGGHGPMCDLAEDPVSIALIERGGVSAAGYVGSTSRDAERNR